MKLLWTAAVLAGVYLYEIKPSSRRSWADSYRRVLFAHRGLYDNSAGIPENSKKAFQRAKDHGYGIELDVQLSKDGIPVIFHDSFLARMANDQNGNPVSGKPEDYTLEELQSFHLLDTEEKIPIFQEVLDLVSGRVPLIVELKLDPGMKAAPLCEKADELLQQYSGSYIVESFSPQAVRWYKRHRPEIIRGQLSEAFTKQKKYQRPSYFCAEHLMFNWLTKPDFIAYDCKYRKNLSRRLTRKLYRCPNVAWTVQSPQEMDAVRPDYDLFIFEGFLPEKDEKNN